MFRKVLYGILFSLFCFKSFSFPVDQETEEDTLVAAGSQYKGGILKNLFLGSHYREEWNTPVRVPLFDIDTIQGGLTPVKMGGGFQTTNLRLVDSQGRQYVIRSVNKTPVRILPKKIRKTIIGKAVQDQTSAEHPYAPLVLPELSRAAGIYYTQPELYYIPYDSSFGQYAHIFAEMLVYFEERSDGDMSHLSRSGYAPNAIGTEKLFEKLRKDNDNKVDEKLFARSRLFDMWIGDWGRHEDNWRWGEFETNEGYLFKPIPRDRDHAFFKYNGLLPYISRKLFGLNRFADFDWKIKNLDGLNRSAGALDRAILTSLTKEEWIQIAQNLQNSLSDSIIETAFKQMPEEAFKHHGREIISKLKSRRDYLPVAAAKHYRELSREIELTGSNQDEHFIIHKKNSNETEVTIVKKNYPKDTLYHRIVFHKETKEIRINGLGGENQITVYGMTNKNPRIRVIAGKEEDYITTAH